MFHKGLLKNLILKVQNYTAQKMKFFITDLFSKCDQVRSFQGIWSRLPKKSLMENFIFCAVSIIWFWIVLIHDLHVKYSKYISKFPCIFWFLLSETYSEPCQTCKVESFPELVNGKLFFNLLHLRWMTRL